MPRRPFTIWLTRVTGTRRSRPRRLMLIPRGLSRSSRRISPGCTGGSRRPFLGMVPPSVVVHDLDLPRIAVLPHETDPILIVDPDAVLAAPIARKGFELIARERAEVVQSL